jgi:hypothetical protein
VILRTTVSKEDSQSSQPLHIKFRTTAQRASEPWIPVTKIFYIQWSPFSYQLHTCPRTLPASVRHRPARTVLLAVIVQLIASNMPTIRMANIQITNDLLLASISTYSHYTVAGTTHHRAIWTLVPLFVTSVPFRVRIAGGFCGGVVVDVLPAGLADAHAAVVQVG